MSSPKPTLDGLRIERRGTGAAIQIVLVVAAVMFCWRWARPLVHSKAGELKCKPRWRATPAAAATDGVERLGYSPPAGGDCFVQVTAGHRSAHEEA